MMLRRRYQPASRKQLQFWWIWKSEISSEKKQRLAVAHLFLMRVVTRAQWAKRCNIFGHFVLSQIFFMLYFRTLKTLTIYNFISWTDIDFKIGLFICGALKKYKMSTIMHYEEVLLHLFDHKLAHSVKSCQPPPQHLIDYANAYQEIICWHFVF